jgi:lipoprotein NlpD
LPAWQGNLSSLDFAIDATSYVVRAGETLDSIAYRHGLSEQALARINPGVDIYNLRPGEVINIRQPAATSNRQIPSGNEYSRAEGEFAITGDRFDEALSYPTQQAQARVLVGTDLTDETLLSNEPDFARALPPMREGTFTEQGFPVEEVLGEDYQIPDSPQVVKEQLDQFVGEWKWPTQGDVARTFDPSRPNGRGIDIVGLVGQDVLAVSDGRVIFAGRDPSNVGKVVIIKHAGDYISVYSHTKDLYVAIDETVKAGDPIASLGANPNGESMLRFELHREGKPLNPIRILPPA